ncbi:alpha/beta fold hydrolase [Corynebacterium sp. AOP40-9SA-29]|uniref:alpha/beta fold hydrolase n=1 Tax=Corynebacterium sp. AOP40-9SA-29 TaxID=3457677 RepID=UPI004033C26D
MSFPATPHRILSTVAVGALTATGLTVATTTAANASSLDWEACPADAYTADGAECADIEVPKDYSDESAGTITLTMSRLPATGERKGVIAGNPGGPGGDALGMFSGEDAGSPDAQGRVVLPADVRESYDLIGLEPRGLTWGTPLDCSGGGQDAGDLLAACEANDPGYAKTVTTDNTARDLEEARKALGEDQLNLYGLSYGGPLMSTYATMFPQHTDRLLLDSSVNPDDRWFGMGSARKQARVDGLNAMFSWLAERDDTYHLGTTPLQVYQRWAQAVGGPYGVQLPATPPQAQDADLPAGSASLPGDLALQAADTVVEAQWRTGTVVDTTRVLLGDQNAAIGVNSGYLGLMNGLYSQSLWPVIGEELSGQGTDSTPAPELTEDEVAAQESMMAQTVSVERAITCNENTVPADSSLVLPTKITQYTGGDLVRYNENRISSGLFCEGWEATTVPTDPSGAELDREPLNIGFSHDTAVSANGAPGMQAAMGGELALVDGYSHGVLLDAPTALQDKVSAYFA